MPIVDMPLEELKVYQGLNPCPPDMDEYWDRAIAEMEALDPQVELVPAKEFHARGVECFDLYFTGVGGARVHAKYMRPIPDGTKHPAVLVFHGYGDWCGEWQDILKFTAVGMCSAALDTRGQGGTSEDNSQIKGNTMNGHIVRGLSDDDPEKLLFRQIFLDTALLARIIMSFDEVDETKVASCGGSQGGGLSIACAALTPNLNRTFAIYPFLSDYKRVWDMDMDVRAYAELRTFFRQCDPLHQREEEYFTKLGYVDIQHLAKRIRAKVLWVVGLMDDVCPASTQFAAYNKITAEKDMLIYPDYGHEGIRTCWEKGFLFLQEMVED